MTRKDYEAVARVIRFNYIGSNDESTKSDMRNIASELAIHFEQDNHRFDPQRFFEACGIE